MQDKIDLATVKAFYYQKVVELGHPSQALKFIEFRRYDSDEWRAAHQFHSLTECDVVWNHGSHEYRIKPETVMHKGGEYPKPLSDISEMKGVNLYAPNWEFIDGRMVATGKNVGAFIMNDALIEMAAAKMYHKTKEAAIAHAKVIYQIED